MRAGIAIDTWKLPIFQRHLTAAGFTFTQRPGLSKDTLLLKVETEDGAALWCVIKAAQDEATKKRQH